MMQTVNETISNALKPFLPLFNAFLNAGFQLYAVGGCVRDWVLGKTPKDIDFTTDALPDQTKEILSANGWKVLPVGELFGTIATIINKKQYEITTFRIKESYTRGSRHPIVRYGKELALDLERRDLTINAMAADIHGNIHDPFDGLGDIQRQILRVPRSSYHQTLSIFGDDPLRMLRLARFKARLGFAVDPDATQAAADMAGSILTVSHERWFSELDGLIRAPNFIQGIQWLMQTGIWDLIFPEFIALKSSYNEPTSLTNDPMITNKGHSLLEQTFERMLKSPAEGDFRWVSLVSFLGYAASAHPEWANQTTLMIAGEIFLRLKFSSARTEHLLRILRLLPEGLPQYRTARELAIELGQSIRDWNTFQNIRLGTLRDNASEQKRLEAWQNALAPYLDDPACAAVRLPKDLSTTLTQTLGVRGKTLGLCLIQCQDAVLDGFLTESDPTEKFIQWVSDHFETAR